MALELCSKVTNSTSLLLSTSSSSHSSECRSNSASFLRNDSKNLLKIEASSFLGLSLPRISHTAKPQTFEKSFSTVSVRASEEVYEKYVVELLKPIGLKFYKGSDAGTYVDFVIPGQNAEKTGLFTPGDRVLETSAVFGDEMWPAAEFGRTMYSVRQRAGILTLKMEKRNGVKIPQFKALDAYQVERNSGNYGDAIRDKQIENYMKKQELKVQRTEEIEEGLKLYKKGEFAEALVCFETVLELQPEEREKRVTYYNIACCYSKLDKISDGLSALEAALEFGFEDYKTIRNDPDLANVRASEEFKPLLDRYDEPFINENAIKAITSVFGLFGGKK